MRLKQKIVLSNAIVFSALIIISVFLNFFYAANIFSTNLNNKNKLKAKLIAQEIDEWLIEKKNRYRANHRYPDLYGHYRL